MIKLIRNKHTVIVWNGKPYGLYREETPSTNNVCGMCDLFRVCWCGNKGLSLVDLCRCDDHPSAWFFVEDWQHLNELILDFVDLSDEKYLNSL